MQLFVQLCRQNDNFRVFSSFESSTKAFDNIFGNDFCLMNTVLLNFLIVCIQTGSVWNGWKFAVAKWTELISCSVGYSLVVHVQKGACFGLSLTLCTIFKICRHFFGNGDFWEIRKNSVSTEFATFWVLFNLMHHAVHMHAKNWLKSLLKKDFSRKKAFWHFLPQKPSVSK